MGQTSYNSAVLALSPIYYWKGNESSGTTESDASGNGRTGEWGGTPLFQQTGAILDETEKSTKLSGDDYCHLYQNSACSPASGDFSVAFWFKRSAITGYEELVTCYESGDYNNGFEIRIESGSSNIVCYSAFSGSSSKQINGSGAVDNDAWHFLVLSYSHSTDKATLYLDGSENVAASDFGASTSYTPASGWWGKRNDGLQFGGYMEKLAFFHSALTSTQVSNLYTYGTEEDPEVTLAAVAVSGGAGVATLNISTDKTLAAESVSAGATAHGSFNSMLMAANVFAGAVVHAVQQTDVYIRAVAVSAGANVTHAMMNVVKMVAAAIQAHSIVKWATLRMDQRNTSSASGGAAVGRAEMTMDVRLRAASVSAGAVVADTDMSVGQYFYPSEKNVIPISGTVSMPIELIPSQSVKIPVIGTVTEVIEICPIQ